uniref:Uncharacterized protein n=1 Tax=Rhizophora mucronata TaxID=61149 RepID=A0A2P2M7L8_RHIMU
MAIRSRRQRRVWGNHLNESATSVDWIGGGGS